VNTAFFPPTLWHIQPPAICQASRAPFVDSFTNSSMLFVHLADLPPRLFCILPLE
jgi:hypothetical protein